MSRLKSFPQTVEVFSALTFFSECATGVRRPTGLHNEQLYIPAPGLHTVNQSSIEWIDGLFAQNEACERLVSSIERRELPTPLISHTPQNVAIRCEYTSAELLANSSKSILAAFDVVDQIVERAITSPTVDCPRCKCTASRILSPLALGDRLLRDFATQEVTILARTPDEKFRVWSATMGFSVQHDDTAGRPTVCVDSGACTEDFIARLSTIFRSAWSIPLISFTCHSASEMRVYAPQGWCPTCEEVIAEPSRTELTTFLTRGNRAAALPTETLALERSLSIDSKLRIEDLTTRQLRDLKTHENSFLQELVELLLAFDLGNYSLSRPCDALPPEDVALLSIAVSLHKSRDFPSTIIVDLPSGILSKAQARLQAALSFAQHSSHSLVLLGEPFAKHESPLGATDDEARMSLERQASLSVDCSSIATNDASANTSLVTEVPLFPSRTSACQILGDELGIMQGIAQLYAASIDARCIGLVAKDFTFGALRSHSYLCRGCKGLGVIVLEHTRLSRPLAKPCSTCLGARFKEPVASTLFRGISYAALLNRRLTETLDTLRSLPRSKDLPQYITLLELQHLPLGMPLALLSSSELRRVLVLKGVLAARIGKVSKIAIEAPHLGFTTSQRDGLKALQELPTLTDICRWL
jgi:hypothetical protein